MPSGRSSRGRHHDHWQTRERWLRAELARVWAQAHAPVPHRTCKPGRDRRRQEEDHHRVPTPMMRTIEEIGSFPPTRTPPLPSHCRLTATSLRRWRPLTAHRNPGSPCALRSGLRRNADTARARGIVSSWSAGPRPAGASGQDGALPVGADVAPAEAGERIAQGRDVLVLRLICAAPDLYGAWDATGLTRCGGSKNHAPNTPAVRQPMAALRGSRGCAMAQRRDVGPDQPTFRALPGLQPPDQATGPHPELASKRFFG